MALAAAGRSCLAAFRTTAAAAEAYGASGGETSLKGSRPSTALPSSRESLETEEVGPSNHLGRGGPVQPRADVPTHEHVTTRWTRLLSSLLLLLVFLDSIALR